jgi:hypothetical protein
MSADQVEQEERSESEMRTVTGKSSGAKAKDQASSAAGDGQLQDIYFSLLRIPFFPNEATTSFSEDGLIDQIL